MSEEMYLLLVLQLIVTIIWIILYRLNKIILNKIVKHKTTLKDKYPMQPIKRKAMNRKEMAEQLKQVITSVKNQGVLAPEDYFALTGAIKELQKNCGNCERVSYCKIHEFVINNWNEWYCAEHKGEPESEPF